MKTEVILSISWNTIEFRNCKQEELKRGRSSLYYAVWRTAGIDHNRGPFAKLQDVIIDIPIEMSKETGVGT